MVPPHIVEKWAREALNTIPGIRVFLVDDLRNGGAENSPHGVNEVMLKRTSIVCDGLRTTLTDLRLWKGYPSARKRWEAVCGRPALFIVGRDRAKLGYFWRHAYQMPRSFDDNPGADFLMWNGLGLLFQWILETNSVLPLQEER
jgi:hypothetical protein